MRIEDLTPEQYEYMTRAAAFQTSAYTLLEATFLVTEKNITVDQYAEIGSKCMALAIASSSMPISDLKTLAILFLSELKDVMPEVSAKAEEIVQKARSGEYKLTPDELKKMN